MERPVAAVLLALLLGGCVGVSTYQVRALGPERNRPVALAAPPAGTPEERAAAEGVAAGVAKAGLTTAAPGEPGALLLRTRLIRSDEEIAGGEGARTVGGLFGTVGKGAVSLLQSGSEAYNASRIRIVLLLDDPTRGEPAGALFWDGFAGSEPAAVAREAGQEAGERMAQEIATQRERWFTRRIGDERLVLTSTPNLIPEGEWVLSNDELLVFHLGHGFTEWLQGDVTLGALPIPVAAAGALAGAGGVAAGGVAGIGVIGTLAVGLKLKVLEEGPAWPGIAASYDMVNVWGGAFGAGGVVAAGDAIAAAGAVGAAGLNLQFNLFTASASKHFFDWLQVGGGLYVLDNHHYLPQSAGFAVTDTTGGSASGATRITSRVPTISVPWLSLEAAAGNHVRFMTEYLFTPGDDWFLFGVRTLAYRTRLGLAQDGPVAFKIDTSLAFHRYLDSHTDRHRTGVFPWLGLALYLR